MSEAAAPAETPRPRRGRGMLVALAAALLLGAGAFSAVYLGLVPLPFLDGADHGRESAAAGGAHDEGGHGAPGDGEPSHPAAGGRIAVETGPAGAAPAFVALEPLLVSLDPGGGLQHLRLGLEIEVDPAHAAEVTALLPRVRDVLNTFLRAVEPAMIERPRSMARLRAQMLRRVQLVCPPDSVRDLLIQEFVLN